MLKLLINDQQADLEGIKFNLQLNSPVPFSPEDGLVEGSFAFGVNFPASPTNKAIFGFPHRLEMFPEAGTDYEGMLYFDGRLIFKIIISLLEVTDFSFRANIKVNLSHYTSLIGERSLQDLTYDGEETIGEDSQDVVDHAQSVVSQSWPAVHYNFPVLFNNKFYGEDNKMNSSWQNLVNNYIHGSGFFPNVIDNDNEVRNYYNLCPFPYLFYVLEHCYSEFGYRATGPVLKDTELASLLIYNNYALDLIEERYKSLAETSVEQTINSESIVQFDHELINIDWCYDDQDYEYRVRQTGNHLITAHLEVEATFPHPFSVQCNVYLYLEGDIVHTESVEIMDPATASIDINLVQDLELADVDKHYYIQVEFIDNFDSSPCTGYVYAESWFSVKNIPWSQLNTYAKSINVAHHVPDIKISTFLVSLLKAFGIVHVFDNKTRDVQLMFLKDILAGTDQEDLTGLSVRSSKLAGFRGEKSYRLDFSWSSEDEFTEDNFIAYDPAKLIGSYSTLDSLPALAADGDIAIVLNLNAAYRWETDEWVWFSDLHYPLNVGDGKQAINIECSPLMMYASYANPAMPMVYPKICQEGSSVNLGLKEFGFHLLFYRGLQPDNNDNSYPFSSCTKYGPTGGAVGAYEFILDGASGLFATWLEDYYDFVMNRTRPVEYDRYFSATEIQALDFILKKRIFSQLFFLQELSIPMTFEAISPATMRLQKI